MKEFLDIIRKPVSSPVSKKILYSVLVLKGGKLYVYCIKHGLMKYSEY